MEKNSSSYQSWDDLVFENRNKEYGAYAIRKSYSEKVMLGFLISSSIIGMLMFLPESAKDKLPSIPELSGEIIFIQPPVIVPIKPTLPTAPPVHEVINKELPPRVVTEPVETLPVENAEPIVSGNTDGVASNFDGVVTGDATNVVTDVQPIVAAPDFVLNPEVKPVYEKGFEGMIKYFQRHLKYPASARKLGMEGTVYVSFIVNGDGHVSDVVVIRGFHPDCDKEAVRVVSKMPGWTGGKQAGNPVRVKMTLPIKFSLDKM